MSQRYQGRHLRPAPAVASRRGKAVLAAAAGAGLIVPAVASVGSANAASDSTWDRLSGCESGHDWSINTGNSFYGGLQFTRGTWLGFGGGQYADRADHASRSQQIAVANRVLAVQGWRAWPACSLKLGLRGLPTTGGSTSAAVTKHAPAVEKVVKATPKRIVKRAAAAVKAAPTVVEVPDVEAGPVVKAAPKAVKKLRERVVAHSAEAVRIVKAPVQAAKPAAAAVTTGATYVVKAGDTLVKIAATYNLSEGWQTIFDANRAQITDPNLILVGQTLNLPRA